MLRFFGKNNANIFPGKNPVVTIGMFDGVHLGHQLVIEKAIERARETLQPSLAITFDIHPRAVLPQKKPPKMVTSLEHRLVLFERMGLDCALILPFDQELSKMTAVAFVKDILSSNLGASCVVLGEDAHFGCDRSGNCEFLGKVGPQMGFESICVRQLEYNSQVISSTAIREAVSSGDLKTAAGMLGRPASLLGNVIRGAGLARTLGFPTLNIDPHHELHPPSGVYLTRTRCGDTKWNSITNIGHRPTIDSSSPKDVLAESHLLDFSGDLYGQTVEISFLKYMRGEVRFSGHEALAEQVQSDIRTAKDFFAKNPVA